MQPDNSFTEPDPTERSALNRLFYRNRRPTWLGHWVSQLFCLGARLGVTPKSWVSLQVRDRASGRMRSDAVVIPTVAGKQYVVSMFGTISSTHASTGMTAAILVLLGVAYLVWKLGPRRSREPGFRYVYVNQDGSARELSPEERRYLSEKFEGGDSGRPYIKWSYESRDGWGSLSGYLERRRVPRRIRIVPVNPEYDDAVKALNDSWRDYRDEGDLIVNNPDGSITYFTNPDIPRKKRFERARDWQLEQQRRREELAKFIA